jgi:4-amino-4-deoxy-L-arabinose transferase-like glycosyltransferase
MRSTSTLGIWLFLGVLWLASLPLRPLFDPDEGRYAEIPREMVVAGEWVTPHLNGLKYFEKPPLQYWTTAAAYEAFGVHDWSARLWATLLAFLCVPMVYLFASRIGMARDTALVAAALLAVNPYFVLLGQINLLDQGLTFFLCLAVFAFVLAQRAANSAATIRNWMLLTWAAVALAVLSKGIVALVLTGGTLALYMLICRDISPLRRLHVLVGLPLFLAITVPWFWLVQQRNPEFAQYFFIHEHFQRFINHGKEHAEAWWYFVPILLLSQLPWLWNARRWRLEPAPQPRVFHTERFLLVWCAVVFVFFSLSSSKLASYIMPMMPALAVLLARATVTQGNAFKRALITSMTLMAVAALTFVVVGWKQTAVVSAGALGWALGALAVCGMSLFYLKGVADADVKKRWLTLAATSIAGFQCLSLCYTGAFPYRSGAELATVMRPHIDADTELFFVGQYRHSLGWYLQRPFHMYDYAGELAFGMEHGGAWYGNRAQFLERWRAETKGLAVFSLDAYEDLQATGMPGRIVARDARSIVVSR